MPHFVQVEIDEHAILDAMAEDPRLMTDVLYGMAERFDMGLMADHFADFAGQHPSQAKWIIERFERSFQTIKSLHFDAA